MTTIYYLSTFVFICLELAWLISPIEKTQENKKFTELAKQFKGKKWDEYSKDYKEKLKSKTWSLFIIIWLFVGLFTFQWVAFLAILLFNNIVIMPLSEITKYSIYYAILHWINSLIGFLFAIFVVINHYHLKIDLTELFNSLTKH